MSDAIEVQKPLNRTNERRWGPKFGLTGGSRNWTVVFAIITLFCLAVYLFSLGLPRKDRHIIGNDGVFYYAYLPAAIIDHTLDFEKEYTLYNNDGATTVDMTRRTGTGLLGNNFPVGAAVLWTPFFLVAHGLSIALNVIGIGTPMDGYGLIYEGLVGLGSIAYGLAALWLIWLVLRGRGDSISVMIATIGTLFATNVLYYMLIEPSMSHAVSLFAASLFLYRIAGSGQQRTVSWWITTGAIAGLMGLVRVQDLVLALLVLQPLVFDRRPGRRLVINSALFGVSLLAVFSVQTYVWQILYGSWLTIPQGEGFMVWDRPMILEVLFSSKHGLFVWHPFFLIALIGILIRVVRVRQERMLMVLILTVFFAETYINAVASDWWAGDSFGLRRFISVAPILALGAAELFSLLSARTRSWLPGIACVALLVAWNGLFMIQYRFGFVPMGDALTFDQLVNDKFRLPVLLWQRLKAMQ